MVPVDLTEQKRLNDAREVHISWLVDPPCSDSGSDHPSHGVDTETLFRVAVESSPSGVLVVGRDGVIVLVNPEIERQFGYTSAELVGRPVEMLLHEAPRSVHVTHPESFTRDYQPRALGAGRKFGRRKDGSEIPVEIALNRVRIAQEVFALASVVDITERCRLETAKDRTITERLAFERLVRDLTDEIINQPRDFQQHWLEDGLRRIVELLDTDQSALWIKEDGDLFYKSGWTRPEFPGRPPERLSAKALFPWTLEKLDAGELVHVPRVDELSDTPDRASYQRFGTKSTVVVPLRVASRTLGALAFADIRAERTYSTAALNQLQLIANVFANALARGEADAALRRALVHVSQLRDQLQAENVHLRREVQELHGTTILVAQSPAMRRVLEQVQQVAATDSTVLLLGETGSGKEMFATEIHALSNRHSRVMVRVNCAALPVTLIESELFGREKGAYTGALARQIGRFELAHQSTLFLDEIGDLPADVQVKLLRVLEDGYIERLGNPRPIKVDTRVIAATHRNLDQGVEAGTFRADLFYRLNVFPITVPPLRERTEDIPFLVWRFVEEFSRAFGKPIEAIGKDNMAALQRYPWPGNIRELRNVVERAMIVATGTRLTIPIPATSAACTSRSVRLIDVEKEHIRSVLQSTGWRVRGIGGAADRLGVKPTTLESRLVKLGLTRPHSS